MKSWTPSNFYSKFSSLLNGYGTTYSSLSYRSFMSVSYSSKGEEDPAGNLSSSSLIAPSQAVFFCTWTVPWQASLTHLWMPMSMPVVPCPAYLFVPIRNRINSIGAIPCLRISPLIDFLNIASFRGRQNHTVSSEGLQWLY